MPISQRNLALPILMAAIFHVSCTRPTTAADLQLVGSLEIAGNLDAAENISGIAFSEGNELLFLVGDEGGSVQVLKRDGSDKYRLAKAIDVRESGANKEADLEGLAVQGEWLYVIGSHSAKREKLDPTKQTITENRELLYDVKKQKDRRQLVKIRIATILDNQQQIERLDLWDRISNDKLLEPFTHIPSKENGLDIEGITLDGDRLLIGFRSPVLRGGYSIVMDTTFKDSAPSKLLFLKQDLGIRDMAHVENQKFLLLCGPPGEISGEYVLKLWDGEDGTPGQGRSPILSHLGRIPPPAESPGAKAEGVAVYHRNGNTLMVVVVFDGVQNGAPKVFQVNLPGSN